MVIMFKNLSQFKKNVEVGQEVKVKNILKDKTEDRVVIEVRTNGISTGVEISHEEYENMVNDWLSSGSTKELQGKYFKTFRLDFQKAKHMNFEGNKVQFLAYEEERYGGSVLIPSPDFEVGDTWLELEFTK